LDSIDKILNLMSNRGVSAYQLSKETGIANNLVSQWRQHKQNPSIKSIKKVAKYFNVQWESLMPDDEETDENFSFNEALEKFQKTCNDNKYKEICFSNVELEYLNSLKRLNNGGIKKVLAYIDDLSGNPEYRADKK